MSNNLNWVGNKVLNSNSTPRQNSRSSYDTPSTMRYGASDPLKEQSPKTAGTSATPIAPGMSGATVTPAAPRASRTTAAPAVPGMAGTVATPAAPGIGGTTATPAAPRSAATPAPTAVTPGIPGIAADESPETAATPTVPFQQGFPPATERGYIPYYLASNIGKNVRAEFIIGSNQYSDKTGKLIEVGINYFVLDDVNSRTHIMCDMYSLKFLIVLQDFEHPFF